MSSFDGQYNLFNGIGAYYLMRVGSGGKDYFMVQGLLGPNGMPATITWQIAFGIPGPQGKSYAVKSS